MRNQPKRTAILVAVMMATSGLALAMSATADHFDPKKDKKTHKDGNDNKNTYVNLAFFGDHIVDCGILTASVPNSVTVDVLNPTDGTSIGDPFPHTQNIPVVGGTEVDPDICLGGSASTDNPAGGAMPVIPGNWQVWATDFYWQHNSLPGNPTVNEVLGIVCPKDDPCGSTSLGQDFIVVAGFATLEATVSQQKDKDDVETCVINWAGTDVCINVPDDDITKTKRLTGFSFCGKGGVSGIDTNAWSKVNKADNTDYALTKAVFIDGLVFYLFDCGLGGLSEVRDNYNVVVAAWNDGTGVPGYNGEICELLVCLFAFPAPGAKCWEPRTSPNVDEDGDGDPNNEDTDAKTKKQADTTWSEDHLALPGIVGTVGWNHDDPQTNLGCTENVNEGTWLVQQGAFEVKIDNFPVVVTFD